MSINNKKGLWFKVVPVLVLAFGVIFTVQNLISRSPKLKLADAAPSVIYGIGVMGDSTSDEYRADNNRGGTYGATTLNWLELLAKYRQLNFGTWGTRESPRRTGYEYNWALSGATSFSLLSTGQHTGLAEQVKNGQVTLVYISIGNNDFAWYNSQFSAIYNGTLAGASLDNYVSDVTNNIKTAIDTVYTLGKAKILISTINDQTVAPEAVRLFPDATKRQRVAGAIANVNNNIRQIASERGIGLLDLDPITREYLSSVDSSGNLIVGGEAINFLVGGNEPHHVFLADNRHAGTVFSGVMANIWMKALNEQFGTILTKFTDQELLTNAGMVKVTPTTTPIPTNIPTSIPATATIIPTLTNAPGTLTPTRFVTPTIIPTKSFTPTPTPRPSITPTLPPDRFKTVEIVNSSPSIFRDWIAFDGLIESGQFVEVNSSRFNYSGSWLTLANYGIGQSEVRLSSRVGDKITFTTSASQIVIQTAKYKYVGSFDVIVDGVKMLTFNGYSLAPLYVTFSVIL